MRLLLLLLLPFVGTGCAAASLATLGTVAGLGATAVGTGANVYSLGKLDSAEMHGADTTWAAVNDAARDLSLTPVFATVDGPKWFVRYTDARHDTIEFTLDARTDTLTRVRIDVGLFGDEPTARLLLQRVRARLPAPTTRPVEAPEAG
jgi:Protein of unknown function (DUF3568)